jgi:hypothetical protein
MLKKLFFFTTNDPENEARALVRSLVSYLRVNSGGFKRCEPKPHDTQHDIQHDDIIGSDISNKSLKRKT